VRAASDLGTVGTCELVDAQCLEVRVQRDLVGWAGSNRSGLRGSNGSGLFTPLPIFTNFSKLAQRLRVQKCKT
jgi:hypothetical protein